MLRSPLAGIEVGLGPRGDGGDRERGMFAQLAAARRLRQAQARLGKTAWLLLIGLCGRGKLWAPLARKVGLTVTKTKLAVAEAIARLPDAPP